MGESRDEKISVRPIKVEDIDDFMAWASDERVAHFCTWDSYTSRDEALHFLTNNAIPHPWYRAICAGDRAVGSISVTPGSGTRSSTAELGYVLAYEYWGKGIATEAVRIVGSTIFREWPLLQRVEAFVDAENGRSQKVLEKAGFVREGLLRKYDVVKGKPRDPDCLCEAITISNTQTVLVRLTFSYCNTPLPSPSLCESDNDNDNETAQLAPADSQLSSSDFQNVDAKDQLQFK